MNRKMKFVQIRDAAIGSVIALVFVYVFKRPLGQFMSGSPLLSYIILVCFLALMVYVLVNSFQLNRKGKLLVYGLIIIFYFLAILVTIISMVTSLKFDSEIILAIVLSLTLSFSGMLFPIFLCFIASKILKRLQLTYRH